MTNHGDDCYFFYYSTCAKGDSCPFRHCEAAMGNETVCNLWQEGRCFRTVCKFRHMEITKKRKEIPCYWENQAAGCQKPHCAFFHEKSRFIDGMFVPPDKILSKNVEQPHEEPPPPPAAPLPTAANPQLRGVKTEAQEPVPSPTHPPVVINPVDDDEDEDDQVSEEGEDGKVGSSPRKLPKSDDSLNFGVSTLEEIRLRKALKNRAGYSVQSGDTSTKREKENIQLSLQPPLAEARHGSLVTEETVRPRASIAERLGGKIFNAGNPLKRSLAERLGKVVDEEGPVMPPQKAMKTVKERLGLTVATQPAETNTEPKKAPEQIRIKTLEEIRQEKAAKSQSLSKDGPSIVSPQVNTKITKAVKRDISTNVKTFSEIIHAKKKRQEEEHQAKHPEEKAPGKSPGESDTAGPAPEAMNLGGIRIKTLEEIRREKAARIQAEQALEAENKKSCNTEENGTKKPPLRRIKKLAPQSNIPEEKSAEVTEKPVRSAAAPETSVTNGKNVKVKTFEEIMREKRLRKQEMEEQAKGPREAEPCQKAAAEGTLKRKVPTKVSLLKPGSSSPASTTVAPDTTLSAQKVPLRKLFPPKSKAASPLNSAATPDVSSVPVKQSSPPPESCSLSPSRSREVPDKTTRSSTTLSPPQQTRAAPRGSAAEVPTSDGALSDNQKNSPEHTTYTKVRPKLKVNPSVKKPAVPVNPGQKRRGAVLSIAAVKPQNSASAVLEEPLQETTRRDRQVFPSSSAEASLSSTVPCSPSSLLDCSGSSPAREELQTVPVSKQSPSQDAKPAVGVSAAREACMVPQSPVLKTSAQPRSRRISVAASRLASTSGATASPSAVDDFEDLINEFTDNPLEDDDVDPEIGEDDLLQELSEMIDS